MNPGRWRGVRVPLNDENDGSTCPNVTTPGSPVDVVDCRALHRSYPCAVKKRNGCVSDLSKIEM